ncbi:hypothetical protein [Pseudomonas sp. NFPP28]|uniref:hypothetical protein n=1 Tax=Pseudomonas sp. NFPP28 TaxID=1566231 RepID=UPI00158775F8
MSRRRWGGVMVLGVLGLTGCGGKPVDRFTLEVDLPAEFELKTAANYLPATGETCALPRRRGKRPERKVFFTDFKDAASRVSYELPLSEKIEGCPSVLRSLEFEFYAKWGKRDTDVGGSFAAISIRDPSDADIRGMPVTGVQELHKQCRWLFRTAGPQHVIVKVLTCSSSGATVPLSRPVQRDQLPGKTLRMVLTMTDEEEPYFDNNWVVVPGGWKRCRGKNFEDLDAFCNGNTTDFKPIKMPDGRICDVYPSCK